MRFKKYYEEKEAQVECIFFWEREKINMRPEILAPVGNREALEAAICGRL